MIDTFRFMTQDFEYNSVINSVSDYPLINSFCGVKNGIEEQQPLILKDCTGKCFYGSSLNLKGNAIRKTGILSINQYGLSFTCSIPKFLNGDNFNLATHTDFLMMKKEIEKQFEEIGIKLNYENCVVDRLDLTKNIETDYKFYEYIELLQKLNFKRDKKSQYNAETYVIGNKSREVCNYDKISEMINNKVMLPFGFTRDSNVFRCECRLRNKDTIQRAFKQNKVLVKDIDMYYDDLHSIRKTILKDKMFLWNCFPDENYSTVDYDSLFRSALNNPENNNVGKVVDDFIDCCILQVASQCIDDLSNRIENFLDVVENDCMNKGLSNRDISIKRDKYKNQFKIKISDKILKIKRIQNIKDISLADLYNELYNKLYIA